MKQSKTLRRWELALLLGVACAALLGVWLDGAQAALSDQVIRLHVLANSDSGADQEWAEDAVNRLADSQKKRPANDSDDEEEYEGLFEGSDVVMALEAGNTKEAKAVIQEMTDNGKEESSIRSSVTRYYKPVYQEMYREKDEAGMRKLRETLVGLGIGDFTRWIQDMEK